MALGETVGYYPETLPPQEQLIGRRLAPTLLNRVAPILEANGPTASDRFINDNRLNDFGRGRADALVRMLASRVFEVGFDHTSALDQQKFSTALSDVYSYIRDQQKAGNGEFATVDLATFRRVCTSARARFKSGKSFEVAQPEAAATQPALTPVVEPVIHPQPGISRRFLAKLPRSWRMAASVGLIGGSLFGLTHLEGITSVVNRAVASLGTAFSRSSYTTEVAQVPPSMQVQPLKARPECDVNYQPQVTIPVQPLTVEAPKPIPTPIFNAEDGEHVALQFYDKGKLLQTDLVIEKTLYLSQLDGSILRPKKMNGVIKVIDDMRGNGSAIAYIGHSDGGGALTAFREAAKDEASFTNSNVNALASGVRATMTVAESSGEEDVTVQDILINATDGDTIWVTCEKYGEEYEINGHVMSTTKWRIVTMRVVTQVSQVRPISRGLRAQLSRTREAVRAQRASV